MTVGDGVLSSGDFSGATDRAIRDAVAAGADVEILAGTYVLSSPIRVTRSGARIVMSPGTVLRPTHAQAYGAFVVTGDDVEVRGGKIVATRIVPNQVMFRANGCRNLKVEDVLVEYATGIDYLDEIAHVNRGTAAADGDVIAVDEPSTAPVAGATSMTIDVDSGTSTFLAGDKFTIASVPGVEFIATNADTIDTTGVTVTFKPPLPSGVADGAVVDFLASFNRPMTAFEFYECVHPRVISTTVYPGDGTRGWLFTRGAGGFFRDGYWGTESDGGFVTDGSGDEFTERFGWRGIEVDGWQNFLLDGLNSRGVGHVEDQDGADDFDADNVVDRLVYVTTTDTGTGRSEGTINLTGIVTEGCMARNPIWVEGAPFVFISGCHVGLNKAPKTLDLVTRFDAALVVKANGAKRPSNVVVQGNHFVRQQNGTKAASSNPVVWLSGVDRVTVRQNVFELTMRAPTILVDQKSVTNLTVSENTAFANLSTTPTPTKFLGFYAAGAATNTFLVCQVANNYERGYDSRMDESAGMPLGLTGPIMWTGMGFETDRQVTGTADLDTIATAAGSNPRIDFGTGTDALAGVLVGDLFELTGAGGVGVGDEGLMRVAAVDDASGDGTVDWIDLVIDATYFPDFSQDFASASVTLDFHPRTTTNISADPVP